MYTFSKTAAQYGWEMRAAGVKPPAPFLTREFLRKISDRIYVYRVGKRLVKNVFLLVSNGYGTLYVKPSYRGYRAAYSSIFPDCLLGRDVDHLAPRSKYSNEHFIALGHIDSNINRFHRDTMENAEIIMKGMNQDNKGIELLTSYPRAREYGLYVLNGYIRRFSSLNTKILTMVDVHEIVD